MNDIETYWNSLAHIQQWKQQALRTGLAHLQNAKVIAQLWPCFHFVLEQVLYNFLRGEKPDDCEGEVVHQHNNHNMHHLPVDFVVSDLRINWICSKRVIVFKQLDWRDAWLTLLKIADRCLWWSLMHLKTSVLASQSCCWTIMCCK